MRRYSRQLLIAVAGATLPLYPSFNHALVITSDSVKHPSTDNTGIDINQRMFNPQNLTTVSGKIAEVDHPSGKRHEATTVVLQVEDGSFPVHLGPSWFMEQQGIRLTVGDVIEVAGSKVFIDGNTSIIATEVVKGGKRLKLRNNSGIPLWGGQKVPTSAS